MLNPDGLPFGGVGTEALPDTNAALRFEDLTIDDDLTLLERVVRYVRSGIALQRLVHVKMIAETARSVGTQSTISVLIPLLPSLAVDPESIIRQHLASQLLPLALVCIYGDDEHFDPVQKASDPKRTYNEKGYKCVSTSIINLINTLITDPDMDVRKAASDGLATLTLYVKPKDVIQMILPIPLRLAHDDKIRLSGATSKTLEKDNNKEGIDDLRITACTLLGDIASLDSPDITPSLVSQYISPTIISFSKHSNFRVRRAAVQALPRVVNGSAIDDVYTNLLPCFIRLCEDDQYRVRKSVGECLVDMSRSIMLLLSRPDAKLPSIKAKNGKIPTDNEFSNMSAKNFLETVMNMRRETLIPVCSRLLKDSNKVVKNGMMQFLGPFIASFYPLKGRHDDTTNDFGIIHLLTEPDNRNAVGGMGVQFFPHANGMVSRLNPTTLSTAALKDSKAANKQSKILPIDSTEHLESCLPDFLEKYFNDAKSLSQILNHRDTCPATAADIEAVKNHLLGPYVKLATIQTGEENVDSEMRVYCAYSLPAVVLLLGNQGWDDSLKECFLSLMTGSDGIQKENGESSNSSSVPLPVKRCLASSFHTLCNILGKNSMKSSTDQKSSKRDLLSVFETHFLRDSDDAVRFNVIKNLPSLLTLMSSSRRSKYLPLLYEIITGDTMLASKRRNALNPMLLNWRQRDMIAQILPNLIMLYKPTQVRQYLWPIVKLLLADSVNLVRENAEWSIPIIFRSYDFKNCLKDEDYRYGGQGNSSHEATKFSADSAEEVFRYLKVTLVDNDTTVPTQKTKYNSCGAFSKRQGFCRILSAMALLLRLGTKEPGKKSRFYLEKPVLSYHPYLNLTSDEYKHVHRILKDYLLPHAIVMKDDRVTNVRLALVKCLRVMPPDIRENEEVERILHILEDEVATWETGGGNISITADVADMTNKLDAIDIRNDDSSTTKNSEVRSVKSATSNDTKSSTLRDQRRASRRDDNEEDDVISKASI